MTSYCEIRNAPYSLDLHHAMRSLINAGLALHDAEFSLHNDCDYENDIMRANRYIDDAANEIRAFREAVAVFEGDK